MAEHDLKAGPGTSSASNDVGPAATPGKSSLSHDDAMHVKVTTSALNVRSEPAKGHNVIGSLHQGATVSVHTRKAPWLGIDFHGHGGAFIHGGYVEPVHQEHKAKLPPKDSTHDEVPHAPHADAAHTTAPAQPPPTAHTSAPAQPAPVAHTAPPQQPAVTPHVDATPHAPPVATTATPHAPTPTPAAPIAAPKQAPAQTAATPAATKPEQPAPPSGTPPKPSDKMRQFIYRIEGGHTYQEVLVFVSAGELTHSPDVFFYFHGQRADLGIDKEQRAQRDAEEAAAKKKAKEEGKDAPHGIDWDESGRRATTEAAAKATGKNLVAIVPQGVMGVAPGGRMDVIMALGLPKFIDTVMDHLKGDIGGDKMLPNHIALSGHSAGGYQGVHQAMSGAGALKDQITDITLMDAEYAGVQLKDAVDWMLQGQPGKSFRIVASPGQIEPKKVKGQVVNPLHWQYTNDSVLGPKAASKGFTIVRKDGDVGQKRGSLGTVIEHKALMKGDTVQCDILLIKTEAHWQHQQIRDESVDDAMLNIAQGAKGNATFGNLNHGGTGPEAQTAPPHQGTTLPSSHPAIQEAPKKTQPVAPPVTTPPVKTATAEPHHDDAPPPPEHHADPSKPDTAINPDKIKVPSNSASPALYGPGGVLNVSHLTRGDNNVLTEADFAWKKEVYDQAVQMRIHKPIFGGLPDDALADVHGWPQQESKRKFQLRKEMIAPFNALRTAMLAAAARGDAARGKNKKDIFPTDVKDLGVASAYRGPETEMHLWDQIFQKYCFKTRAARQGMTGGEYGKDATNLMLRTMNTWKAVPGHSNHSNGTAMDLWAIMKSGKHVPNDGGNQDAWMASWHYAWLLDHSKEFHIRNYPAEAWHWEYDT